MAKAGTHLKGTHRKGTHRKGTHRKGNHLKGTHLTGAHLSLGYQPCLQISDYLGASVKHSSLLPTEFLTAVKSCLIQAPVCRPPVNYNNYDFFYLTFRGGGDPSTSIYFKGLQALDV